MNTVVSARPPAGKSVDVGDFTDLTSVRVLSVRWGAGGLLDVEFADDLDAATAAAVVTRVESRNTVEEQLRRAAVTALAANRDYLAKSSTTAAEDKAQLRAVTKQVNALVRLVLGRLDGTD